MINKLTFFTYLGDVKINTLMKRKIPPTQKVETKIYRFSEIEAYPNRYDKIIFLYQIKLIQDEMTLSSQQAH